MHPIHTYRLIAKWTGNRGEGTTHYRAYDRSHTIVYENKSEIHASSDPTFRGDATKHNPEDLLLGALSGCHMLSYLHVCAINGVNVVDYVDNATGTMIVNDDGSGHFTEAILHPRVIVSKPEMIEKAIELHHLANKLCFIANSCNFPVLHKPIVVSEEQTT